MITTSTSNLNVRTSIKLRPSHACHEWAIDNRWRQHSQRTLLEQEVKLLLVILEFAYVLDRGAAVPGVGTRHDLSCGGAPPAGISAAVP
jgi:hypothetical protein